MSPKRRIRPPSDPEAIAIKVRNILMDNAFTNNATTGNAITDNSTEDGELSLGEYDSPEEAAMAFDFGRIFCGQKPVNFPTFDYMGVFKRMGLEGIPDYRDQ